MIEITLPVSWVMGIPRPIGYIVLFIALGLETLLLRSLGESIWVWLFGSGVIAIALPKEGLATVIAAGCFSAALIMVVISIGDAVALAMPPMPQHPQWHFQFPVSFRVI